MLVIRGGIILRRALTSSWKRSSFYGSEHVYEPPESREMYKLIQGYEGSHRFDPSLEWTEAEEKALVRTVCTAGYHTYHC